MFDKYTSTFQRAKQFGSDLTTDTTGPLNARVGQVLKQRPSKRVKGLLAAFYESDFTKRDEIQAALDWSELPGTDISNLQSWKQNRKDQPTH